MGGHGGRMDWVFRLRWDPPERYRMVRLAAVCWPQLFRMWPHPLIHGR